eukprot:scaffold65113_cov18-Tisochrysis_lutea.AAC.2
MKELLKPWWPGATCCQEPPRPTIPSLVFWVEARAPSGRDENGPRARMTGNFTCVPFQFAPGNKFYE